MFLLSMASYTICYELQLRAFGHVSDTAERLAMDTYIIAPLYPELHGLAMVG